MSNNANVVWLAIMFFSIITPAALVSGIIFFIETKMLKKMNLEMKAIDPNAEIEYNALNLMRPFSKYSLRSGSDNPEVIQKFKELMSEQYAVTTVTLLLGVPLLLVSILAFCFLAQILATAIGVAP